MPEYLDYGLSRGYSLLTFVCVYVGFAFFMTAPVKAGCIDHLYQRIEDRSISRKMNTVSKKKLPWTFL